MNPFITRWDEPFAGKEKRVVNICLHGLNREGYHGSVWESDLCEDKNLII